MKKRYNEIKIPEFYYMYFIVLYPLHLQIIHLSYTISCNIILTLAIIYLDILDFISIITFIVIISEIQQKNVYKVGP